MLRFPQRFVLSGLACALVIAVGLVAWALAADSSEAQSGTMHNCPAAGKWTISVWSGDDGTETGQALATCGEGAAVAAYYLDPETQVWWRWFAGRPQVNNLSMVNDMQGMLTLGSAQAQATPGPGLPNPASVYCVELGYELRIVDADGEVGICVFPDGTQCEEWSFFEGECGQGWALEADSSHGQDGTMHNCPQPGKWAIAVWGGDDGTDAGEAFATCGEGAMIAAYDLDPQTQGWSRWFADQPGISTLSTLDNMHGVSDLGGAPTPTPTPTPTPIPTPTPPPTPSPEPTKPAQLTLTQAIQHGLVQVQITGNGASSGDAINIGLTRTGPETLEIELPRGTILVSTTPGFQDMVVHAVKGRISGPMDQMYYPASRIVLDDDEEQWFVVEAYCLDLYGDNPEYGTDFVLAGAAHQDVLAVLDAAAQMGRDDASIYAIQIAVWAVAQDISRAQAEARISADEDDFVQARAVLERAGIDPASTRMFQ